MQALRPIFAPLVETREQQGHVSVARKSIHLLLLLYFPAAKLSNKTGGEFTTAADRQKPSDQVTGLLVVV